MNRLLFNRIEIRITVSSVMLLRINGQEWPAKYSGYLKFYETEESVRKQVATSNSTITMYTFRANLSVLLLCYFYFTLNPSNYRQYSANKTQCDCPIYIEFGASKQDKTDLSMANNTRRVYR